MVFAWFRIVDEKIPVIEKMYWYLNDSAYFNYFKGLSYGLSFLIRLVLT